MASPPVSKELKKRWSDFIWKVYETDPLTYPKCQGEMRIISFIDQPEVIKKILQHLAGCGKNPCSPFDELRANGGPVEIIDDFPFMLRPSKDEALEA